MSHALEVKELSGGYVRGVDVLGGSVLQETYGDELVVLEGGRPAVNVGHHDHHHHDHHH